MLEETKSLSLAMQPLMSYSCSSECSTLMSTCLDLVKHSRLQCKNQKMGGGGIIENERISGTIMGHPRNGQGLLYFVSLGSSSDYAVSLVAARTRTMFTSFRVKKKLQCPRNLVQDVWVSPPFSMLLATSELSCAPGCFLQPLNNLFPPPLPSSPSGVLLSAVDIVSLRLFLACYWLSAECFRVKLCFPD